MKEIKRPIFPTEKITQHKYYCENCENKFYSLKTICSFCGSKNVGIDEPIIKLRTDLR